MPSPRSRSFRLGLLLGPLAAIAALGLTGCRGKVLGTGELHAAGTVDIKVPAGSGKIALWADTDGAWHGNDKMPVEYGIDVMSGGKAVGHVECSTMDASESVCGLSITNGNSHSGDCELKMRCDLPALPAGDVTLHVTARPSPNVESIKKISLNLRQG